MSSIPVDPSDPWLVLHTDPKQFDIQKCAPVIAPILRIPVVEAAQQLHHRPGLLGHFPNQPAAEEFQLFLHTKGIPCAVVNKEKFPDVMPPHVVTHLEFAKDGLKIWDKEKSTVIPPPFMGILATCFYRFSQTKIIKEEKGSSTGQKILAAGMFMATGLPIGLRKKKTETRSVTESDVHFFADLIMKPSLIRIRFPAESIKYDFLGENKSSNTTENFRTFLSYLIEKNPSTMKNRSTDIWIERKVIGPYIIDDEEPFSAEIRWLQYLLMT